MGPHHPDARLLTAFPMVVACFVSCPTSDASAQAAGSVVFSGLPFTTPLFQRQTPPTPKPGGPIYAPTVTMPVPPLARDNSGAA